MSYRILLDNRVVIECDTAEETLALRDLVWVKKEIKESIEEKPKRKYTKRRKNHRWTIEEKNFIKNSLDLSRKEVSSHIPHHTPNSISVMRCKARKELLDAVNKELLI